MLTRAIKTQLALLTAVAAAAVLVLCVYYLRLPSLAGIGQYTLHAELPQSGGLYPTANVTYRGVTIGKVTQVQPTPRGARAEISIGDAYLIPADASANVHSVSAVGEQYLDLVSDSHRGPYFHDGQTVTDSTVPHSIGPALDAADRGLSALPENDIGSLLHETSQAVGGLGPSLQRLVDATGTIAHDINDSMGDINDIIVRSAPIIDSQADSGDAIARWAVNLNTLAAQTAQHDEALRSVLATAAPTADMINATFTGVGESLPQTLANLAIVADMLKRYHSGVEQALVFLPQAGAIVQTVTSAFPGQAHLGVGAVSLNQPPPCLTGFLPAAEWRSPADTSEAPLPADTYCKIPQETQGNAVRGARNTPCVDVPGKRAATPRECRSSEPYVPLGTNPWYGDPNQIRNCPAPGARCDQPVDPGRVIPAPSINNGRNPLPADELPGTPPPVSDPVQRPGSGTVECNGQQPNPCLYTPAPTAIYDAQSGTLAGPDGATYSVDNSSSLGDDGWKQMLAPPG